MARHLASGEGLQLMKRVRRTFKVFFVLALLTCSYIAWSGITGREPIPIPGVLGGGSQITGTDSDFDELNVTQGQDNDFEGTIKVENPTSDFQDVFVTVDLFDGDQNVGELLGSVTLKPRSSSSVSLSSSDAHTRWDDAHVDLLRLP